MAGLPATKPAVAFVPALAARALRQELDLTPKPGLVDRANSGAHRDMDYALFLASIDAITPWFARFEQAGFDHAHRPAAAQLRLIRPMGIACEQAMFAATDGVNTHKGGIFSLGLLSFAAGRLRGLGWQLSADALCNEVSAICRGLVARELAGRAQAITAGEKQFRDYGLTGARGEAEQGFITVRRAVLPFWQQEQGERRLHNALLRLMAVNRDSNLVSRGGLAGLRYVQDYAQQLLATGWEKDDLRQMDQALIARHLSPGGSADLLAVAYVLAMIP
ncbi:triphosphoribosyl-dephospho-CoA synthase CitG [Kosakonia cowanii]|uniref:triphosphoribosyl-dephospho-CoA synthase CitG n=1 Tax=Kosakonia cowanii TaxID=208223 RepID=UPI0025A9DADF|nr:triphosphoribosyl-dephospho-CoA synthase CitG [Kosakonia cowanii]MDM9615397.1 triphosphoribosyl-dephospho-CoA synthase CitG [Kosakonia cowanii]MDP4560750.1 triphosphoribosyl-dephospho-CoA synthase CitG [Kosakonia cowanii]